MNTGNTTPIDLAEACQSTNHGKSKDYQIQNLRVQSCIRGLPFKKYYSRLMVLQIKNKLHIPDCSIALELPI